MLLNHEKVGHHECKDARRSESHFPMLKGSLKLERETCLMFVRLQLAPVEWWDVGMYVWSVDFETSGFANTTSCSWARGSNVSRSRQPFVRPGTALCEFVSAFAVQTLTRHYRLRYCETSASQLGRIRELGRIFYNLILCDKHTLNWCEKVVPNDFPPN